MANEIEIKLLSPDKGILKEIFTSPVVAPYLEGKPVRKVLHAYYLDTPSLRLARAGVAYRLRKEGDQWVAAVKTDKRVTRDGLHVRKEWEYDLPAPVADFKFFKDRALVHRLANVVGDEPLVILFESRVVREASLMVFPDETRIELAADEGEIICGGLREPILEVELELKDGDESRLAGLSKSLQKAYPLVPGNRGKYVRGLALLRESGVKALRLADDFFRETEPRG